MHHDVNFQVQYFSVADLQDKQSYPVCSQLHQQTLSYVCLHIDTHKGTHTETHIETHTHRSSWDDSNCSSMSGWTVLLLIGLWGWWGEFMADLPRLESRGSYFYCRPTPSYHNSCPHISCLSTVRNSRPIRALLLSSALLFHSPLCVSLAACSDLLDFGQFLIWSVTCGAIWIQELWNYLTNR